MEPQLIFAITTVLFCVVMLVLGVMLDRAVRSE